VNTVSLKSNIWKFYVITALGIRFIAPIRILYLISFGLSFAQIGMMELAAAVMIVFLEVPTGVFADIYGRKKSRLIAYFLSIIAFACLSFGSNAMVFIFGWALSGAADAFQSGAQDALIFDTLKQLNREGDYIKVKSHFLFINAISVIIGSISGAYLYSIDRRLPWYLISGTIILSTAIFMTIKEPNHGFSSSKLKDKLNEFKKSFNSSAKSINVWRLMAYSLVLTVPMYVFTTLLNQPYLVGRGFDIKSLGIIFAVFTAAGGIIASLTHKVEPYLKQRLAFLIIIILLSIFFVLMGLLKSPVMVLTLVIGFYVVDNFKNVLIDNYLNRTIASESRATVLSVQSLMNNLLISLVFVFVGYLTDVFSINIVLEIIGVLTLIMGMFVWLKVNKRGQLG
jgi:MFS family permease